MWWLRGRNQDDNATTMAMANAMDRFIPTLRFDKSLLVFPDGVDLAVPEELDPPAVPEAVLFVFDAGATFARDATLDQVAA
jgi:hypothetical protein